MYITVFPINKQRAYDYTVYTTHPTSPRNFSAHYAIDELLFSYTEDLRQTEERRSPHRQTDERRELANRCVCNRA